MAAIKYIKNNTTDLYKSETGSKTKIELLWGDRVELLSETAANGRYRVKARGIPGYVNEDHLGDESLLELYFIDVGQGDGILIKTPGGKHILIDGGYMRKSQPSGKNAADFVDWKFFKDYGMKEIVLDAMIASHCDADHYGGLWDLLNPEQKHELDVDQVVVKKFYHAGVSWWSDSGHKRYLGPTADGFLTRLLTGKTSVKNGLGKNAKHQLQGNWKRFLQAVLDSGAAIKRISHKNGQTIKSLAGFAPENGDVDIKILGPLEYRHNNKPAYKDLGSHSQNTNGNSILLRLDHKRCRILLTGDLNARSQQDLLEAFKGQRQEFACDVAKSCHHGSEDCSYEFLENVKASATIISSGDNETHSHPRPNIVSASAITGHRTIENDKIVTPLIYSTEISRSLKLGRPYLVERDDYETGAGTIDVKLTDKEKTRISFKETKSGGLQPKDKTKAMKSLYVVSGIIYGLVNVRTDGNKIMCAVLNEGKYQWDYKVFASRF